MTQSQVSDRHQPLWAADLSGSYPGGYIICSRCMKGSPEAGGKFGTFTALRPPEPHCPECSRLPGFIDQSDWSPSQPLF